MIACTQTYSEQYREGHRCGRLGTPRDRNPYFSRSMNEAGQPESVEVWRSKYDVWRAGWTEGHDAFERDGAPNQASSD